MGSFIQKVGNKESTATKSTTKPYTQTNYYHHPSKFRIILKKESQYVILEFNKHLTKGTNEPIKNLRL